MSVVRARRPGLARRFGSASSPTRTRTPSSGATPSLVSHTNSLPPAAPAARCPARAPQSNLCPRLRLSKRYFKYRGANWLLCTFLDKIKVYTSGRRLNRVFFSQDPLEDDPKAVTKDAAGLSEIRKPDFSSHEDEGKGWTIPCLNVCLTGIHEISFENLCLMECYARIYVYIMYMCASINQWFEDSISRWINVSMNFPTGLCSDPDLLLPFANDRAGTIKYKTNPATAYQHFQVRTCFFFFCARAHSRKYFCMFVCMGIVCMSE